MNFLLHDLLLLEGVVVTSQLLLQLLQLFVRFCVLLQPVAVHVIIDDFNLLVDLRELLSDKSKLVLRHIIQR